MQAVAAVSPLIQIVLPSWWHDKCCIKTKSFKIAAFERTSALRSWPGGDAWNASKAFRLERSWNSICKSRDTLAGPRATKVTQARWRDWRSAYYMRSNRPRNTENWIPDCWWFPSINECRAGTIVSSSCTCSFEDVQVRWITLMSTFVS